MADTIKHKLHKRKELQESIAELKEELRNLEIEIKKELEKEGADELFKPVTIIKEREVIRDIYPVYPYNPYRQYPSWYGNYQISCSGDNATVTEARGSTSIISRLFGSETSV